MRKLLYTALIGIIMAFMMSCGGDLTTKEVSTPELEMTAEGPLFEGSNTATATWEFDLAELLAGEGSKVSKAKVTAISVELVPDDEFPSLEKIVFEVTSKNTSMTRIGLFEGSLVPGQETELSVAGKQDNLASAFEDGKMTFVGDFDLLAEEYWDNVTFKVKVTFELGIK